MLIFLDTEFTALDWEKELLSLGMVSEDGQHHIYLEVREYEEKDCSDFTLEVVLKHFGKSPDAQCDYSDFGARLRSWFATLPGDHVIACDSDVDAWFLRLVLQGRFPTNVRPAVSAVGREFDGDEWELSLASYFQSHPHRSRHHALHDAWALRWAYHRLILGRAPEVDHD